jgi:hypothetical protein
MENSRSSGITPPTCDSKKRITQMGPHIAEHKNNGDIEDRDNCKVLSYLVVR